MISRSSTGITSLLLLGCSLVCLALLVVDRAGFPLVHGLTVSRSFFLFELATGLGIAIAVSFVRRDDRSATESDAAGEASVAVLGWCVALPFAALLARVCSVSLASFVAASALMIAWAGLVARVAAASSAARSSGWLALGAAVAVPQGLAWLAGTAGARIPVSIAYGSPVSLLPALERDATTAAILAWAAWLVAGGLAWLSIARRGRRRTARAASGAALVRALIGLALIGLPLIGLGMPGLAVSDVEASASAATQSVRSGVDVRPAFGDIGHAPGWIPFDVTVDGGSGGVSGVVEASGPGVQPTRFEVRAVPGEVRRATWLVAIDRVPARVEWRGAARDGAARDGAAGDGTDTIAVHDIVAPPDESRRVAVVGVAGAWREEADRLASQLFPSDAVSVVDVRPGVPLEAWLSARFDLAFAGIDEWLPQAASLARLGVPVLGLGSRDGVVDGARDGLLGIVEHPDADVSDRIDAWRAAIVDPLRRLDALLLDEAAGFGLAGSFGWNGPVVDRLLATAALLAVAQALGLVVAWRRTSRARHAIVIATAAATSLVAWIAIPVPEPVTRVEGTVVRACLGGDADGVLRVTRRVRLHATSAAGFRFESRDPAARIVGEARPPVAWVDDASRAAADDRSPAVVFDVALDRTESVTIETLRVVESLDVASLEGNLSDAVIVTRDGWTRVGDVAIDSIADRLRDRVAGARFERASLARALGDGADPRGWPASVLARLDRFVPLLGDRTLVVGMRPGAHRPDPGDAIQRFVRPEVWVVSLP